MYVILASIIYVTQQESLNSYFRQKELIDSRGLLSQLAV